MKDTDNIDHEIPWHEDPLGIGGGSSNVQKMHTAKVTDN